MKVEQKKAIGQLLEGKYLLALLPTGYGKLCVLVARRAKARNLGFLLVIMPLTSIAND